MENKNPMTFKSDLTPEFGGAVLMNEAAKKDKAVMAALRSLQAVSYTHLTLPTIYSV